MSSDGSSSSADTTTGPQTPGDSTGGDSTTTGSVDTGSTGSTGSTTEDDGGSSSSGELYDPNEDIPPPDAEGCHAIFAQDLMPTFEITVLPIIWEQLMDEWNNGAANELKGLETKPYHSLAEFRYRHPSHDEDIVITNASIRLRGNPTYWDPIPGDKMQFQIGFHTQDDDGRFLGIKRLVLDAATFNRHFLRDRLSLMFMRDIGIRAPCANNARLMVNGEYYGLFTNLEKVDEIFLERVMEDPSGDLWKRANWALKTNEETSTPVRLDALRDVTTIEELDSLMDVEQALLTYAAEAVIPDSDGAWAGGLNFYLYDDPKRGKFMLLPWDMDNTFERFDDNSVEGNFPTNPDPYLWEKDTSHGRPWYNIALSDPAYFDLYVDMIDDILHSGYEKEKMLGWVDEMTAQIEDSAIEDTNKPYSNELYYQRLADLQEYIQGRYDYLDDWLICWQSGGVDDGTGHCMMP